MFSFTRRTNDCPTSEKTIRFRPRLEALDDRCLPSGGVLDPTFGSGGMVTTPAAVLSDVYGVATYANAGTANDGKVVAVGDAAVTSGSSTVPEFAVCRFNLNGTLDASFGSSGTGEVTTMLPHLKSGVARDVVIQPDGKIVAVGYGGNDLALVRYNADGSLDASFGSQGVVLTTLGKRNSARAESLALQADGKIVVGGIVNLAELALVRYTTAGALDTSFGTGGIVTTPFSAPIKFYGNGNKNLDLALDTGSLDPNAGKIVVVTQLNTYQDVVVRYNANGSLDTSFAAGAGYETLNLSNIPSVAIQTNGRIIVAEGTGSGDWGLNLDRLNLDGSYDATFGSGGHVVVANPDYLARHVMLESDGKILVGGYEPGDGGSYLLVARFNATDGSLDTSFGAGGVAVASGSHADTFKGGMALEPDGRIVLAGSQMPAVNGGWTSGALARFLATGPQIGSFTASPNPVTAGSSVTLSAATITDSNLNSSITQVAFYVDSTSDGMLEAGTDTFVGYATQTSPGVWTFTFPVNLSPGTYTLFAQAEDSYGVFGDPTSLTLTVQ